jgi:endonuclease/exonuclease/phosphatase (EEP) superfamily protein YafD
MTWRRGISGDIALRGAWLLTFGLIAAAAMSLFGRWCWPCDLLSHFPGHLAVVALATTMTFAVAGRIRASVLPAVVAAWSVAAFVPFYTGAPTLASPSNPRVIRVVALNVAVHNRHAQRVIRFIRAANPDVVVVIELNDFWIRALEELTGDFPFRRFDPRSGHLGVGLMSRLPLTVLDGNPAGLHALVARLGTPHLTIVGTHTHPPFTPSQLARRNQQFAEIATFVRRQREPVVVVGDLNSSSWSAAFGDLLRDAGLRDTRLGRGVQPTWPAWLPMPQVPIDHALVSAGVHVHGRFVGGRVGSDHLPVVVDVSVEPAVAHQ